MSLFFSLYNLLSVLIYSISFGICLMMYGSTGKKELRYAGLMVFTFIVDSVYTSINFLTDFRYSSHSLALTTILTLTVVKIYILGRIIYVIFKKNVPATFYISLCVVVIIGGLTSDWLRDIYWSLDSAIFTISVLILCALYWYFLELETNPTRRHYASKYQSIFLIMTVATVLIAFYIVASLCLFQTVFSKSTIDLYINSLSLIVSIWFIMFCQREFKDGVVTDDEDALEKTFDKFQALKDEKQGQIVSFCSQYDLTEREYEILHLILAGKTNQEISTELYITVGTVKAHAHSIFSKLDVSGRSQLVTKFLNYKFE